MDGLRIKTLERRMDAAENQTHQVHVALSRRASALEMNVDMETMERMSAFDARLKIFEHKIHQLEAALKKI